MLAHAPPAWEPERSPEVTESASKTEVTILCDLIREVCPVTCAILSWLEASHGFCLHSRGGVHKGMNGGVGPSGAISETAFYTTLSERAARMPWCIARPHHCLSCQWPWRDHHLMLTAPDGMTEVGLCPKCTLPRAPGIQEAQLTEKPAAAPMGLLFGSIHRPQPNQGRPLESSQCGSSAQPHGRA